jgi:hypothetical protein
MTADARDLAHHDSARLAPELLDLLQRQLRDGLPDLAGTEVATTIHVSERLINELIAKLLSKTGKIREVRVRAEESNRVTAEIRVSGPGFLPGIPVRFAIEEQPELPQRPTLRLRLEKSSALIGMAASMLPSLTTALPWIGIEGDRIRLDIRRLLAERNMEGWLDYVTDLRVYTRGGAIVLDVRARIRPK